MKKIAIVLLMIFCFTGVCAASPIDEERDTLYKTAASIEKQKPMGDETLIRQLDLDTYDLLPWQSLKDAEDAEAIMMQCTIYKHNAQIILIMLFETSPSGDWSKATEYYFWPNGKIARIDSVLDTFMGNVTVLRTFYYSKEGTLMRKEERIQDMDSEEIIPKEKAQFMDIPPELYESLAQLKLKLELPEPVK